MRMHRTPSGALLFVLATALLGACVAPGATASRPPAGPASSPPSTADADASGVALAVSPRPIRIAYTTDGLQFLPLRIAIVEGFFARRGLEATMQRVDANAGAAGLLAGQFEYMGSFSRVINSNMHGIPLRFIAMLVERPMHVLVGRPEITRLADLRGKTVGSSSPGGVEDFIVRTILRSGGLEPDRDVQVLPAGRAGSIPALESGQFAAIGAQPPQSTLLVAQGYNILGRAAPLLPDMALTATATTANRVAQDPAEVKAFAAAFLEALRLLHSDRETAAAIAARWLDLPLDIALATYDQSIDTFSRDGSFAEATLRRGVELEREKDPTLTWDRPLTDLVASEILAEAQRAVGLAP